MIIFAGIHARSVIESAEIDTPLNCLLFFKNKLFTVTPTLIFNLMSSNPYSPGSVTLIALIAEVCKVIVSK